MLTIGIYFQPFERIERIEPLEHYLGTKFFYKTMMPINGIRFQPFERIEHIEPLELFLGLIPTIYTSPFYNHRCL
jgi:hypothetical protein